MTALIGVSAVLQRFLLLKILLEVWHTQMRPTNAPSAAPGATNN